MFQKISFVVWSLKRKTIYLYFIITELSFNSNWPPGSPQSAPAWECWRTGATRSSRPSWAGTSPWPATTTWRRSRRFSTASSGTGQTRRAANMEIIARYLLLTFTLVQTSRPAETVKINHFHVDPQWCRSSTDIYLEVKVRGNHIQFIDISDGSQAPSR